MARLAGSKALCVIQHALISRGKHREIDAKYVVRKMAPKLPSEAQSAGDTQHPGAGGLRARTEPPGALDDARWVPSSRSGATGGFCFSVLLPSLRRPLAQVCFLPRNRVQLQCILKTVTTATESHPFTYLLKQ